MMASLISPKTNKLLFSSLTACDCVTYTNKGSRQQWPATRHEPCQMIYAGQSDKENHMTHLETELLELTCKGQPLRLEVHSSLKTLTTRNW